MVASRSRPRIPVPAASPLPIGGSPFDGRYSGCGLSSTHGIPSSSAAMPPHAVMTSDTTSSGSRARSRGTLSTAICAARRWILAPASRSRSVAASPSSSTASMPAARAASSHSTPVNRVGVSAAARKRWHSAIAGNECPGSGPATTATRIGPTLPQRHSRRLTAMAELTETSPETPKPPRPFVPSRRSSTPCRTKTSTPSTPHWATTWSMRTSGFPGSAVAAARQRCFAACRAASASR